MPFKSRLGIDIEVSLQGSFHMTHAELQAGLGRDDLTADLWPVVSNLSHGEVWKDFIEALVSVEDPPIQPSFKMRRTQKDCQIVTT